MSFLLHRIGCSPQVRVAGMACLKPGRPGRFFYRVHVHRRRKGDGASMKSSLGNHAASTLGELEARVCSRLRSIQRRPGLIRWQG